MKKSLLLSMAILTTIGSAIAFGSGFSSDQSTYKKAEAATTVIKPFAKYDFTSNTADNPGRDSSGNGFDLKKHSSGSSACTFNVDSTNGLSIYNELQPYTDVYVTSHYGYSLYAPQLGTSGYDMSDMIEGAYSVAFTAKFDPTVKNPGNYLVSCGCYEDCFTIAAYQEYSKTNNTWSQFIEFQFHNSGVEGLTYNTENTTTENGRKMDTMVYRYFIKTADGTIDHTSEINKDKFNSYAVVADASNKKMHFYFNGEEKVLHNRYGTIKYENGVDIPMGIKLTDLTGKVGRSYSFVIGSQLTINGGSGDQFATFSMKDFSLYNCALSRDNVVSIMNTKTAYLENEVGYRSITKLELTEPVNLQIDDVNSVSSLIAGGKLPKTVKATLNDGSTVQMPVFWYDDPDEGVNKIYGIPSIGKFQDSSMPDNIDGIFNPHFLTAVLDYNYVVNFEYNENEFTVSDVSIGGTATPLSELPKVISFKKGSTIEVSFKVKCLKDHGELAKVMYDGTNWPSTKSGDTYSCSIRVGKGALFKLVLGIETGTITYCTNDGKQVANLTSKYSYGGDEDLLPLEDVNAKLSPNSYSAGYFLDNQGKVPFTKENIDYYNIKNFVLYVNEKPLKSSYNLTVDMSSIGGSIAGNKAHYDYDPDDAECFTSNITITPAEGYLIDSISWNSESITIEDPRAAFVLKHSFTSDVTLTIRFRKLNTYKIEVKQSGQGTIERKKYIDDKPISVDFSEPYYEGDEIHISIAPDSDNGYTIESVEFGGELMNLTATERIQGYSIPYQKIYKNYVLNVKFALPKTYTVTINGTGDGGTATGNKDSYNLGDETAINLKPNTNYHISSVMWGTETISLKDNIKEDGSIDVIKTISESVTLTVNFEADKYFNVVASYNHDAGSVNNLSESYKDQAYLTGVTVTANSGYTIKSIIWGNQSVAITDNETMTLDSLKVSSAVANAGTCTLTIIFDEAEKNIIYVSKSGSGTIEGATEYEAGVEECQFIITADIGYVIKSVKWNDADVTGQVQDNGKLVCQISSTASFLVVKFVKASSGESSDITFSIENSSDSMIGYKVYGEGRTFVKGDNVSLSVCPENGFEIDEVSVTVGTGVVYSTNGVFFILITNLNANTEFKVSVTNTKTNKCSVVTSDEHIHVYGVNNNEYYASGTKTISVLADEGYVIDHVTVNSNDIVLPEGVSDVRSCVFDIDVSDSFSINAFSKKINDTNVFLTKNAFDGGDILGIDESGYLPGTYATLTVKADSGYMIQSVTVGGKNITITNSQSFTFTVLVNEAATVTASFTPKTGVTITSYATNPDLGIIEGTEGYELGDTTNITITASTGSYISNVQWNGRYIDVSDGTSIVVSEIIDQEDNVLNVTFESIKTYQITVGEYDKDIGTISGVEDTYLSGEKTNITISASDGYEIDSIVYNGKLITPSTKDTYVLKEEVKSNASLEVAFKEITSNAYKINLLTNEGGEIEDLRGKYAPDSEVEFVVTANEGKIIYKIAINGEEIKINNDKTMTVNFTITGDTAVDVLFANPEYVTISGGCVNSITGSLAAIGGLSLALVGLVVLKKKER